MGRSRPASNRPGDSQPTRPATVPNRQGITPYRVRITVSDWRWPVPVRKYPLCAVAGSSSWMPTAVQNCDRPSATAA